MVSINAVSCVLVVAFVASAFALPTQDAMKSDWKSMFLDGSMEKLQSDCLANDEVACMKYKVLDFADRFFTKESFQVSQGVTVVTNSFSEKDTTDARSADASILDKVENYVQSHDVIFALPGSTMTYSPRNLDQDEVNFSINFAGQEQERGDVEGRKSKVKKILIPILVFVLLKAMTLIPLFIGALGLKAWNALQLSFFSFVISVGLAVFQLCKKIAADNSHHPVIAHHNPWEYQAQYAARSMLDDNTAQDLAYSAHQE